MIDEKAFDFICEWFSPIPYKEWRKIMPARAITAFERLHIDSFDRLDNVTVRDFLCLKNCNWRTALFIAKLCQERGHPLKAGHLYVPTKEIKAEFLAVCRPDV